MNCTTALAFIGTALLSLNANIAFGESVEELNAKFEKDVAALSKQHAGELIKYLKKNPKAGDFGAGLKSLEELEIPDAERPALKQLVTEQSARLKKDLEGIKDPAKALAKVDELIDMEKFLETEDSSALMLRKYDLLVQLPEGKERMQGALGQDGVVPALIDFYKEKRLKKEGLELLGRLKKDFPSIKAATIENLVKTFEAIQPLGDTYSLNFKSTDGKEIDIASLKGKVVLVDFWATWCGPCVAEMPNVIKVYEKYHDKGFEYLGISLDQDEEELKAFVAKNKMPWPQYFDGKGWGNEIAKARGISSIPATFLIDKDNKLVAVDLRGKELEAKVSALLGAKTP